MNKTTNVSVEGRSYSIEIRALFNSAFCALVLNEFIKGYQSIESKGSIFPLLFFILPIVLQKSTRDRMNGTNASTSLQKWLVENSEVRVELGQAINGMISFTKQAIIFGIHSQVFQIQNNYLILTNNRKLKQPQGWNDERGDILKKSMLLGKWFAQIDDCTTIYAMFGVRV